MENELKKKGLGRNPGAFIFYAEERTRTSSENFSPHYHLKVARLPIPPPPHKNYILFSRTI